MSGDTQFDVAIAGYGPVGATLAALLAKRGLSVVVIESQPEVYDKPRAIAIDHEGLRILQWAGLGGDLTDMIGHHPGTDFLGVEGQVIRKYDPQPPPFPLDWLPTATFVQPELEAMLRWTIGRAGQVRVLMPCTVNGFYASSTGVEISLQHADTRAEVIRAGYLVGCDGAGSFVRKRLDLPFEDLEFDEWWLVVDTRLKRETELPTRCVQYCRPSRPATFIIGPRNLRRWEIKVMPGENPEDYADPGRILEHLKEFVDVDALEIWRTAVYRFHALVATRWRRGRVFIAGDAAHQMPPFMGQGLCSGLRDAANLAWKLALVARGGGADAVLNTYETERKPHIRELVATTKSFGRVIGELDEEKARQRDVELRNELARGTAITVRQRYIPPLTDGMIAMVGAGMPASAAGTLFVQPRVHAASGDKVRLDDMTGEEFLIVSRSREAQDWLDKTALAIVEKIGATRLVIVPGAPEEPMAGNVPTLVETASLFTDWLAENKAEIAVVRPDRYVYGVAANAADLNRLIRALARQVFGEEQRQ